MTERFLDKPVKITEQTWPENVIPIVSVFNWVYNHKDFIRESIDTILMQETTFPVEIIIHDDASNDGTLEIIQEYERKYPQLFKNVLQKENQWSKGNSVMIPLFEKPRGRYIALAHGDDYWTDPLKLQKQVDFLEANEDYSMCFTHQLVVSETGQEKSKNRYPEKNYTTADIIQGFIPGTQTMVFRNYEDLVRLLSKYLNSPSGDRMLAYCCSLYGDLYLLNEFTAAYRQTGSGVWTSFNNEESYFFSLEEFVKFHISIGLPVNNEFVHKRVNGAYAYWFKKDRKNCIQHMRHVMKIKKKYGIKSHFFSYILSKLKF